MVVMMNREDKIRIDFFIGWLREVGYKMNLASILAKQKADSKQKLEPAFLKIISKII